MQLNIHLPELITKDEQTVSTCLQDQYIFLLLSLTACCYGKSQSWHPDPTPPNFVD